MKFTIVLREVRFTKYKLYSSLFCSENRKLKEMTALKFN